MGRFRFASLTALFAVTAAVTGLAAASGASDEGGAPGSGSLQAVQGPNARDAPPSRLEDEGVGAYTDSSVANQISTFTINPVMVSCGVGTLAAGQWSGPFAMLMYAKPGSYAVDHRTGRIQAAGEMRSITRLAGDDVEDVEHDFIAIAVDGPPGAPDRFDVHLRTPFWNASNPMCARSSEIEGGCRFGGELLMGEVEVQG